MLAHDAQVPRSEWTVPTDCKRFPKKISEEGLCRGFCERCSRLLQDAPVDVNVCDVHAEGRVDVNDELRGNGCGSFPQQTRKMSPDQVPDQIPTCGIGEHDDERDLLAPTARSPVNPEIEEGRKEEKATISIYDFENIVETTLLEEASVAGALASLSH